MRSLTSLWHRRAETRARRSLAEALEGARAPMLADEARARVATQLR
jgi:hypothetical protein